MSAGQKGGARSSAQGRHAARPRALALGRCVLTSITTGAMAAADALPLRPPDFAPPPAGLRLTAGPFADEAVAEESRCSRLPSFPSKRGRRAAPARAASEGEAGEKAGEWRPEEGSET